MHIAAVHGPDLLQPLVLHGNPCLPRDNGTLSALDFNVVVSIAANE
jgi:hypothetical protein